LAASGWLAEALATPFRKTPRPAQKRKWATAHPKPTTLLMALFVATTRVSIRHTEIVAGRGHAATVSRHKFRLHRAGCVLKDAASANRAALLA